MLEHVVQHFNVKAIEDTTTTGVMNQLDRTHSAIKVHFQEQLHFYRLHGQGAVSEHVAERAAEYAGAICPAHLDANNTLSIRMAKDITARDARGLSTFVSQLFVLRSPRLTHFLVGRRCRQRPSVSSSVLSHTT